jgi:hypothetical protein
MTTGEISWQERYELESQRRGELDKVLRRFSEASLHYYGNRGYSSGYYEGVVLELLLRGNQEDLTHYLAQFNSMAEDFEHRTLINALKKDPE